MTDQTETPLGWQPIETAWRDGRTLLLGNPSIVVMQYWGENDDGDEAWEPRVRGFSPTHWMDVPDCPAEINHPAPEQPQ